MKWNSCFGFFWYNDEEIFRFTKEDYDRKARDFAAVGINIVITFSCTHFRWTMRPYWGIIEKALNNIVEACHRYGILVVEHHSSHLTFDPLNEEDWIYMENILNKRGSSINSWEGLRQYVKSDPDINGFPISSFRQIDGRTGKWARTGYRGYGMCFNNPHYKKEYFTYLESIYKTGIDGIMTDDVQWFGNSDSWFEGTYACACGFCRELFKKQTGYELPKPGDDWTRFYGDFDNPVFIAWKKFKADSVVRFHMEVNKHFESIGYKMLRPYYVSDVLSANPTAYAFDSVAPLLDWMFQENTFSSIIRYSWPRHAVEAAHRYALAQRNGIPSMSMFYPDREDSFYFSWALAQSWGQLYLATSEGHDLTVVEKKYREFEKKHFALLKDQKKVSDVAFYFSIKTRDFIKDSAKFNMSSLVRWMQSAYFTNKCFDMVFENDTLNVLKRYPLIVLPNVAMLSDEKMNKLITYALEGGTLIITGILGERDDSGRERDVVEICGKLGVKVCPYALETAVDEEAYFNSNGSKVIIGSTYYTHTFEDKGIEEVVLRTVSGLPVGIRSSMGKGMLYWFLSCEGLKPVQNIITSDRFGSKESKTKAPYYAIDSIKSGPGKILEELVSNPILKTVDCPDGWLVTCYRDSQRTRYMLHIINSKGLIENSSDNTVSHQDIIPQFSCGFDQKSGVGSKLMLRWTAGNGVYSVRLHTPENEEDIELNWTMSKGWISIDIPSDSFKGYAVVEVVDAGE